MKNKVYVIEEKEKEKVFKYSIVEFLLGVVAYALILLIVNNTFKGFYIESFLWAVLASLFISLLNSSIKPILVFISLPLTFLTLGIFYPVINMIILKITGFILGSHFEIEGFWVPFFIAIFISILRLIFDKLLVKPIMRSIKR